ncbi:MAG: ACP S-malonyltransferase [Gammaproteobacteria bacterium]
MTTCFVFPGQGSQSVGMVSKLAQNSAQETLLRETFAICSEASGIDLWKLATEGPEEELSRTEQTQPALLAASVSAFRIWKSQGGAQPDYVAGHSLGEYSALVAAGCADLGTVAKLVRRRGELMQGAVPEGQGRMVAILGLEDGQVEACCRKVTRETGSIVEPANYNAPLQVVIAGQSEGVEAASKACKEAGAKRALPLSVSVPSHCSLMQEAAAELAQDLRSLTWNMPAFPLIQNVSAEPAADTHKLVNNLVLQLHRPVRWSYSIQKLKTLGVKRFIECGPKKVISGLIKKIDPDLRTDHIESLLSAS